MEIIPLHVIGEILGTTELMLLFFFQDISQQNKSLILAFLQNLIYETSFPLK